MKAQSLDATPWQKLVALPWWHPLKILARLLIALTVGFVVICAFLYAMQGRLIYPGAGQSISTAEAEREVRNAGLVAWSPQAGADPQGFTLPDFRDPAPRGTFVVMHGNGEFAWYHADTAKDLRQHGFRAFLYEYPGYGGRTGTPSEKTIVPEVQAIIRALDKAGLGPVYIWGQSLGSGVAAAACADESLPVRGLLLITPWDALPNVGAAVYPFIPVRLLMIDRYNSVANLAHFQHPICLARSDQDDVIPPRLSIHLYATLPEPKKEIVFIGAHHNDWPLVAAPGWLDEALDFIAPK